MISAITLPHDSHSLQNLDKISTVGSKQPNLPTAMSALGRSVPVVSGSVRPRAVIQYVGAPLLNGVLLPIREFSVYTLIGIRVIDDAVTIPIGASAPFLAKTLRCSGLEI